MADELPAESGAPESPQPVDWQKRYTDTHAEYNRLNEQFSKFEKDPEAVLEFIRTKHPDLLAEEEEETPQYEEPPDQIAPLRTELDEIKAWRAEREAERAQQLFQKDLTEEAGDRTLSRQARDWIFQETVRLGDGRENLKKAAKEWFEFEDGLAPRKRPKAPHVPANGEPATGTKRPEEMTDKEMLDWQTQRYLEMNS